MKKSITIIICIFCAFLSSAQTIVNYGGGNIHTDNRGGYEADSVLGLPVGNENSKYPSARMLGRIQIFNGDSSIRYYNGVAWIDLTNYLNLNNRPVQVSAGTGLSYNATTGVFTNISPSVSLNLINGTGIGISGSYPNLTITNTNLPNLMTYTARSLNTNFTPSPSRVTNVSYSVQLTATVSIVTGTSTAECFLEYSTDAGATWITAKKVTNTQVLTVGISLNLSDTKVHELSAYIPSNGLVRLRSNIVGTGSVTLVPSMGQEIEL